MNTKYTIKNFRVFDEKGVTVDIKPITILTGCNSSGKSSIVKSMVLLDTYLNEARHSYLNGSDIDLQKYNLNFHKKSTSSLGNFKRILNRDSEAHNIIYEFKQHSFLLGEDIKVSLVFFTNENDIRKEGKLFSFSIFNSNDQMIYSSSKESSVEFNFDLIRDNFARFLLGVISIEKYQDFQARCNYSVYEADEEYKSFGEEMPQKIKQECEGVKKLISLFEERYGKDAFADIMQWYVAHDKDHFDIIDRNPYKRPSSYLFDKIIENPEELVISLVDKTTLFSFPLLDAIAHLNRGNFLSSVKELIGDKELSKETLYGLNKIAEDFFDSDYEEFIDFFRNKEKDVLNRTIPNIQGFMPIVSPIRWIAINRVMEDRYYESASYYLGPGITYYPDGSADEVDPKRKKEWQDSPVTFCTIYDVLMSINEMIYPEPSLYYYMDGKIRGKYNLYSHHLLGVFRKYVSILTQEALTSIHFSGLDYFGTSVVNVKRSYPLDGDDEFTSFLHSYFEAREKYLNKREGDFIHRKFGLYKYKPDTFINKWIQEFGLGHSVSVKIDTEGQGITFKLHKDKKDTKGHLIAEEGYGVTQLITLLLRIERSILLSKMSFVNVNKSNIDFALYSLTHDKSQVQCQYSESNIAIEEPEVHLHPKFQSKLAELFVDAYTNYNVHFIIETHSEYIIRKLQLLVANKNVRNSDISILYVYDKANRPGYEPLVKKISIRKDGMLNGNFGEGFFDEADMLSMFLLTAQGGEDE